MCGPSPSTMSEPNGAPCSVSGSATCTLSIPSPRAKRPWSATWEATGTSRNRVLHLSLCGPVWCPIMALRTRNLFLCRDVRRGTKGYKRHGRARGSPVPWYRSHAAGCDHVARKARFRDVPESGRSEHNEFNMGYVSTMQNRTEASFLEKSNSCLGRVSTVRTLFRCNVFRFRDGVLFSGNSPACGISSGRERDAHERGSYSCSVPQTIAWASWATPGHLPRQQAVNSAGKEQADRLTLDSGLARAQGLSEGDGPKDKVVLIFEGDGFLYNMCRILAGTICEVGAGGRHIKSIPELLLGKPRESAGRHLSILAKLNTKIPSYRDWRTKQQLFSNIYFKKKLILYIATFLSLSLMCLLGPTLSPDGLCLDHVEYETPHFLSPEEQKIWTDQCWLAKSA